MTSGEVVLLPSGGDCGYLVPIEPPPAPSGKTCSVTGVLCLPSPGLEPRAQRCSGLTLPPRMPLGILHLLLSKCGDSSPCLPWANTTSSKHTSFLQKF